MHFTIQLGLSGLVYNDWKIPPEVVQQDYRDILAQPLLSHYEPFCRYRGVAHSVPRSVGAGRDGLLPYHPDLGQQDCGWSVQTSHSDQWTIPWSTITVESER